MKDNKIITNVVIICVTAISLTLIMSNCTVLVNKEFTVRQSIAGTNAHPPFIPGDLGNL